VSRWYAKPIRQFRRPADPLLRAVQEPPVDHEAGLGAVLMSHGSITAPMVTSAGAARRDEEVPA